MRSSLYIILIFSTLAGQTPFTHSAGGPDIPGTTFIQKRMVSGKGTNVVKDGLSFETTPSISDSGDTISSIPGIGRHDHTFEHRLAIEGSETLVLPMIFDRPRFPGQFPQRSREEVYKLTNPLHIAFLEADEDQEAVILRNIKHLEAQLLSPEDLAQVLNQPEWVVAYYKKSWLEAGLDVGRMVGLGEALGISGREVEPLTSKAFARLERFLAQPPDMLVAMVKWYKEANMVSLSSEEQVIFESNLNTFRVALLYWMAGRKLS